MTRLKRYTILCSAVLLVAPAAMAEGAPKSSSIENPMVITMVIIMLILLLAIALLANVLTGAAAFYRDNEKKNAGGQGKAAATVITTLLLACCLPAWSQDGNSTMVSAARYGGLSSTAFYFMVGVLAIELVVLLALLYQLRVFLAKEKVRKEQGTTEYRFRRTPPWWDSFNRFRPVEQEAQIDLGHDYDGIRELDNRLPPWWLYGFYATIIFGAIYLWRHQVSHTAPSSIEEYTIAVQDAEREKAAYLKKAANNVDENNVHIIADAGALAAGKSVFQQNCAACHGKAGEGLVGPNLTDDYWLHGGSIADIFKTVKYGWPDKGMRSWKDDLSAAQIAQVSSYIKTLYGTHPSNAKEPQGEIFRDTGNPNQQPKNSNNSDSTNRTASVN